MSPQRCTICTREDYPEIMAMLKANFPRTTVANRFKLDYTSLGRCWSEHRPHDQEYEVAEGIKRTQKALDKELRKKLPHQNRMLVKDLEMRLKDFRSEQRQLHAIRKEENPALMDGGEALLTIEALDKIIANYKHSNVDGDGHIRRVEHLLRFKVPSGQQKEMCRRIVTMIEQAGLGATCEERNTEREVLTNAQN